MAAAVAAVLGGRTVQRPGMLVSASALNPGAAHREEPGNVSLALQRHGNTLTTDVIARK